MASPGPQAQPQLPAQLADVLQFRPKWWWDPVPEWLIRRLELPVLARLTVVQLDFEQAVLEAQVKANRQIVEIVRPLAK